MITASGSRAFTSLASSTASVRVTSSTTARSCAQPSTSSARALPARAASAAPLADHSASGAPTTMALPRAPGQGRPASTKLWLTPVPIVRYRKLDSPCPAPSRASAAAAALTSDSTRTWPTCAKAGERSASRQSQVAALVIRPSSVTSSGTAMPMPSACPAATSRASVTQSSSTAVPPLAGFAGSSRRRMSRPLGSSTRPAASLVPPASMPTTRLMHGIRATRRRPLARSRRRN
jgi:hypothetical protein